MATQRYNYFYGLFDDAVVGIYDQGVWIDTGSDPTLVYGEFFDGSGPMGDWTLRFEYASEDGLVVSMAGDFFWLTDTPRVNGEIAPDDGDFAVICFLAGTRIATPVGSRGIEELKAGDLVLTAEGETKPLRWLARQTVSTRFADPLRVLPIRIRAGALGENLPERDLFVSPDHALLVAGLLVQAGALVNGTSITRHAEVPDSFVYYHVELGDHSLVLAEGVPAETFVDNVDRRRFDNWHDVPEAAPIAEMERPRVKAWRQVPERIRSLLAERAEALGFGSERKAA